jgi:hypothetical protein
MAWPGIPEVQINGAGAEILGCPCSRLKSIQSRKALDQGAHYRDLRVSAFEEWSRAVA